MNHTLHMYRNSYNDGWTSAVYVVIPELCNKYFAIGGADKGREEMGGDLKSDIVFIGGRAMVIDNQGGTGAEIERNGRLDVKLGDTITLAFEGPRWSFSRTFTIVDEGDHYNAKLVEVV